MKISTKGRYALRVMIDISLHSADKNVSIREIAERQLISDKYLEGIVARLNKAGLVRSVRGKYGGYQLTRKPEEYSVYEILDVAEDSMALVACLMTETNECPQVDDCKTVHLWTYLQKLIRNEMTRLTLQDVIDGSYPELP